MVSFSKILRNLFLILIIGVSFWQPVMAQTQTDGKSDGKPVEVQEPVNEYDFKPEIVFIERFLSLNGGAIRLSVALRLGHNRSIARKCDDHEQQ